jgi:hypothetical protein
MAFAPRDSRRAWACSRRALVDGRTEFLERRVTAGFEKLGGEIGAVAHRVIDTEMSLATEVVSLASVVSSFRDHLVRADLGKLVDRVRVLEEQVRNN